MPDDLPTTEPCRTEERLERWMRTSRAHRSINVRIGRGGGWIVELCDAAPRMAVYYQGVGPTFHEAAHLALQEHAMAEYTEARHA